MKKKLLVAILTVALVCALMQSVALAASITLYHGEYKDLSTIAPGTGIIVSANASVALGGTALSNVTIASDGNTTIEILDINIAVNDHASFIFGRGGTDTLNLIGTSYIKCQGADPVVDVQSGTNLEICGNGTLFISANAGMGGREIGGYPGQGDGTISISGDATVFLQNEKDNSITPSTTTHCYIEFNDVSEVPAKYTVPADWTFPCGAYMKYESPSFTDAATNTNQKVEFGQALTALEVNLPSKMQYYNVISGSLPTGITVNNNGTFSGTTSEQGTFNATIEVTDDGGRTATTDLEIMVYKRVANAYLLPQPPILLGENVTITPTVSPSDAYIKDITWTSSNPSVASVSSGGVVTANGVGSATITMCITCESGNTYPDTCTIKVEKAVTGIDIAQDSMTLYKDKMGFDTGTLTATITPSDASNKGITWQSSDTTIATVNASGVVIAKKAGTATITATAVDTRRGTQQDTCTVTVEQAMTGLIMSNPSILLVVNDPSNNSYTLTYEIIPSDTTIQKVEWQSMDNTVATVDAGVVTAVGVGTTQVSVKVYDTSGRGMQVYCQVIVKKTVTSITFDNPTASIDVGTVASVGAVIPYTVLPADATDKSVTITSSNEDIATVIGGMVTGLKEGITRITVQSVDNPSVKAEIILNVRNPIPPAKPSDKLGNVVGKLIDSLGNPLVGYNVTLCSEPQTVVTDANGAFMFTGVNYDEHALIVNSPVYGEIGRFTLSFTSDSSSSATVDNGAKHLDINFSMDTIEIDVLLQANAGITEFNAGTVAFTTRKQEHAKDPAQVVENPCTGYWD